MPSDTFRLREHMMLETGSDEDSLVLVDGHSGAMCVANPSAATLLRELRRGTTAESLAEALQEHYILPPDRVGVARDVVRFLDVLSGMGVIELLCDQATAGRDDHDTELSTDDLHLATVG